MEELRWRSANVVSLSAGTARLPAFHPGEVCSPTSIYLCRRSQIFDSKIDLQKVRKRSKVLIVEFLCRQRVGNGE
jgi:hypothetical protein